MKIEDIANKTIALLLMGKNDKGEDDWVIVMGSIIHSGTGLLFKHEGKPEGFPLPDDALERMKPTDSQTKDIMSGADYYLSLTVGPLPEGPSVVDVKKRAARAKIRSCWIKLLAIFVLLIGMVSCLFRCFSFRSPPPQEEPFLSQFHAKRAIYEELHLMVQADTNLTTLYALTEPQYQKDFPPERFNQYTGLLEQVNSREAFRDHSRGDVGFVLADAGGFDWAWELSAVWRDNQPTNVVTHWKDLRIREGVTYKPIEGNWYFRMLRVEPHF